MSKDLKIPPGTEFYSLSKNGDIILTYYKWKLEKWNDGTESMRLQYYSYFNCWKYSSEIYPKEFVKEKLFPISDLK